jgi:N-acetylglucosaminyldiphosphoundecaprenol N-acetyl-beta-D-mannosaminyltransferase
MAQTSAVHILGSRVDAVDMDEAQRRIVALLDERRFAQVVTFGSEMAMFAHRNSSYRRVVNEADLVVPDTVGVVYAARLLGESMRERVAGVELIDRLCRTCPQHGVSIFLLGGAPGVAEAAAAELRARHPELVVAGTHDGYFSSEQTPQVIATIQRSGARLLLLGLGFPKQEFWVREHADELGPLVCMGIGGSLDVISGRLSRAPAFVRKVGLEWFYRLLREPHRLGRQLALPQFAALVAAQAARERLARKP